MSLPLVFTSCDASHEGYVKLVHQLKSGKHADIDMYIIAEIILHLELRVNVLEKQMKRLQDENVARNRSISE